MSAGLSLRPDPWNRWAYDYTDPRYSSPEAQSIREARFQALRNAPRWMIDMAHENDMQRDADRRAELIKQGKVPGP